MSRDTSDSIFSSNGTASSEAGGDRIPAEAGGRQAGPSGSLGTDELDLDLFADSDEETGSAPPEGPPRIPDSVYAAMPAFFREPLTLLEGRDRDRFLMGQLAHVAAALPQVRTWYGQEPLSPNLYAGIVGSAATGKGIIKRPRTITGEVEERLARQHEHELRDWNDQKERHARSPEDHTPPGPKPVKPDVVVGGRVTYAGFIDLLSAYPHALLSTTEISEITGAIAREHGGWSNILKQGFHNDLLTDRSRSNDPIRIPHPAPSLLFAATPGTFSKFVGGMEDGLFSRLMIYTCSERPSWRSQRQTRDRRQMDEALSKNEAALGEIFESLRGRDRRLWACRPDRAQLALDVVGTVMTRKARIQQLPEPYHASIRRAGTRTAKLAAIFATIRCYEDGGDLRRTDRIGVQPPDLIAGMGISFLTLLHAFALGGELFDPRAEMNQRWSRFYAALKDLQFEYGEEPIPTGRINAIAAGLDIPSSTTYYRLSKWEEEGLITDTGYGTYRIRMPKVLLHGPNAGPEIMRIVEAAVDGAFRDPPATLEDAEYEEWTDRLAERVE